MTRKSPSRSGALHAGRRVTLINVARKARRVTLIDVARKARVDRSVVAHVINEDPVLNIGPETRRRVLTAIEQLRFRPNAVARSFLAEAAGRGGNLLLNISPRGDGSLPAVQVSRLKELGGWLASHGESVIGVDRADAGVQFYGPVTRRASRIYLHLVMPPTGQLTVHGVPVRRIRGITLLGDERPLPYGGCAR